MIFLTISVDFDNTIVCENYPAIGKSLPGAIETLNALYEMGHTIIINSCRSGEYEKQMKKFLQAAGIRYNFVNENTPERIKKYEGLDCRKIGADVYIDDHNIFTEEICWPKIYAEIIRRSSIEPGDHILIPDLFPSEVSRS